MPAAMTVPDLVNRALRQGASIAEFRITREQAQELRKAEERGGQEAGLRYLLMILRTPRP